MNSSQHVLVVNGLTETEQVLKAVLEPRGVEVRRLHTDSRRSTELQGDPRLVVVHHQKTSNSRLESYANIPQIVIGSPSALQSSAPDATSPQHNLPHPFQYSELIQAMETLLGEPTPPVAA